MQVTAPPIIMGTNYDFTTNIIVVARIIVPAILEFLFVPHYVDFLLLTGESVRLMVWRHYTLLEKEVNHMPKKERESIVV